MPVPDAHVELKIGGTWTDITSDVFSGPGIQLSWGRTDEGRTVDPGSGALVLKSPDGLYSNRNPNSPYYGLLGRNTQIRYLTTAGETFLRIADDTHDRASTPDHASLDITGDLDVRIDARLDDWAPAQSTFLIGKWDGSPNSAWYLSIGSGGAAFTWSSTGSNFLAKGSAALPVGPGRRLALRVTLDVDNGAGGHTVTFYTAPTIAGPWAQLSTPAVTAGTTSIAANSHALEVGDIFDFSFLAPVGEIYAAEVRSGIDGSIVASPDFSAQTAGITSFVDSSGRTWTVQGDATITDRRVRRVHVVPHWPAHWHTSGHDQRAPIQSAGILRRLGQGKKALASALARRLPAFSPLAYWPCEDGNGATAAASPIMGVAPLHVTGWTFGQDDTLAGAAALPTIAPGGTMRGQVPAPAGATTRWSLCMPYRVDGTAPATEQEMLSWQTTGTVRRWRITMGASGTHVFGYDADGTLIEDAPIGTGADLFDGWHRLEFKAVQNGSNVDWTISWTEVGGGTVAIGDSVTGSVGTVSQVNTTFGAGLPDIRVGHIAFFSELSVTSAYDSADHGYTAELATTRLSRLANEESTTVDVSVVDGDTSRPAEAMGPQRPRALLDLLQDCAESDGGILYEDPKRAALIYRDRTTLENQEPGLVLDYSAGDVAPPFEPTESDLQLVNDVTVNRDGGSFGRAVEEDGPLSVDAIGLYDTAITLSLAEDEQAERIAGWRLHLGTWDEARFPTVRIMLHHRPDLVSAVTTLQIGDRIRIVNTPSWMPPGPVDLLVQRIDDDIRMNRWDVTLTCSPAGPWTVGVVDDATLGRVDTDGSELFAAVTTTATQLPVKVTAGAVWTQDPADMPFDIKLGGEEVTVTAVTGVAQDAFGRVVANGWGTADSGQAWANSGGTAANFSVTGSVGQHSITTLAAGRATTISTVSADINVKADFALSVVPTGDNVLIQLMARRVDASNYYNTRLQIAAGGAMTLTIRKLVAGVETQLATFATGLTYVANAFYTMRFVIVGDVLTARVWPTGTAEPLDPQIALIDTSFSAAGFVGLRTQTGAALTNPLPITVSMDNLSSTPQLMTVTRSANGIVKAHSAGADVRLAQPTIVAL